MALDGLKVQNDFIFTWFRQTYQSDYILLDSMFLLKKKNKKPITSQPVRFLIEGS